MGHRARRICVGAVLVSVAACSSDRGTAPPTTTATTVVSTSTTPTSTEPITIDTGGTQLLGMAATADEIWAVSFDAGTIARIDPATNSVVGTVEVPGAASLLGEGADVWVATYGGARDIYRFDAAAAEQTAAISTGEACCDLTFGNNRLWLVDPSGAVKGIDPETNTVVARFPVDIDRNAHTNVVYAGDALWVSSDTTALHRVDPVSGAVTDFDVGGGVPFVAREGLLWGASTETVWAVDPSTGEVRQQIELERSMEVLSLEVDGSTLWVGIRHPGHVGAVQHIDLSSGDVLEEFKVDIPARLVLAFGSAWVTDSGGSNVYRIPATAAS